MATLATRHFAILWLVSIGMGPVHSAVAQDPLPEDRSAGAAAISAARMRVWLDQLTSDAFDGRATGTPGYRRAAELLRDHFRAVGIEPGAGGDSFWQVVPWSLSTPDPQRTAVSFTRGGETLVEFRAADVLHGSVSVDSVHEGPAAIATSGTVDGSDLADLDLDGRHVVVIAREGLIGAARSRTAPMYRRFAAVRNYHRVQRAVRRAGGQLVAVVDDAAHEIVGAMTPRRGPTRESAGPAGAARGRGAKVLLLPGVAAERLLGVTGGSLPERTPGFTELRGVTARAAVRIVEEQAPAYNVLGIVRGSDPELADEYVVIGCHLDHKGRVDGVLYPGADDDGSGIAAVMAIAEALAKNPVRPKRSVLLVAFAGEEVGLIGSRYFVEHPTVPLENIAAELQIDMIGRDANKGSERARDNRNSVYLIGADKLSSDLHELCARRGARTELDLKFENVEDVFTRSDHFNFAREGVPVAFFFTGFHEDYHEPTDTVDKINFRKLVRITRWIYDVAFELAQADARPRIDPEKWEQLRGRARENPAGPLRDR